MDSRELLADLKRAVDQFSAALELPSDHDVVKAGCIQYFEFSFELAWKTIKRFAEDEGIAECNSPKSALKAAFANRWIGTEIVWLDMLMSRNKMSHTYDAASALEVYSKLNEYLIAMRELVGVLFKL